jgi:uncharacterized protein YjbI with pentapeptide repeats
MPPKTRLTCHALIDRYHGGERNFSGSDLDDGLSGDLSDVVLDEVDLSDSFVVAYFTASSLRGAKFRNSTVKTCDFRGCDLRGADFSGAAIDAALFDNALLDGARFEGATAYGYTMGENERPES